ncbi:MAG: molybdopterin cofactor-binding domain-containing protein [Pararobbsia sp.]
MGRARRRWPAPRSRAASRKIREKARRIAAHLLEASPNDVEFDLDRFVLKGSPGQFKTLKEVAWAAYNNVPPGMEMGLEAVDYYDPPNFTFPFGAYACVLDINRYTGETRVRRFYALDDCGTRINPMIIEGQIHGGLTEASRSRWVSSCLMTKRATCSARP